MRRLAQDSLLGAGLLSYTCSKVSEGWEEMKNTGKRIFAVLVFAVVSSLPLAAMAGVWWSQR